MKVIFSHGKESGPWGSKIKTLAELAKSKGYDVDSIDYSDTFDPDERAERLVEIVKIQKDIILVGSSMGGYASLVASEKLEITAMFLLAPALYIEGYKQQNYKTKCPHIEIVHGWADDIIPVQHSIDFAQESDCTLHIISGDHRLNSSIKEVTKLFDSFLSDMA